MAHAKSCDVMEADTGNHDVAPRFGIDAAVVQRMAERHRRRGAGGFGERRNGIGVWMFEVLCLSVDVVEALDGFQGCLKGERQGVSPPSRARGARRADALPLAGVNQMC